MEENTVGYRFHPTDEELINHYLKNKILGEFDEAIGEININDYDPASLRSLSKIRSEDPTWYFFAPVIYTSAKKTSRKRVTKSGLWKPTGKDREIKDKNGNTIGLKKTLVYKVRGASTKRKIEKNPKVKVKKNLKGKVKKKKNPWVMHEYQIQSWSHPELESYVICKIKYKGEEDEGDIIIPSIGETSQSLATTPPEVKPVDEENGLSVNDLTIQMIKQDGGNIPSGGEPSQSLVSEPNTVRTVINTPPEVEHQLGDEENGLSLNDLTIPMNEQEDPQEIPYLPQDSGDFLEELDLNTLLDNNNNNNNVQQPQQTPYLDQDGSDDYWSGLLADTDDCFPDLDLILQENYNDYKPRKPLSGIIVDYSTDNDSDNDAESISVTSYQGTLSPVDSVGSLNKDFQSFRDEETLFSSKDQQTSQLPLKQEVFVQVKTKKEDLLLVKEAMEKTHKNPPPNVYLMNMVIGIILLVALIVSVLSTVKA